MGGLHTHVLGGGVAVAPGLRHQIFFSIAEPWTNPLEVNPACHTSILSQQVTHTRPHAISRQIHFGLPLVSPKKLNIGGRSARSSRQATQQESRAITSRWVLIRPHKEKPPQRLNWRGYSWRRRAVPQRVAKATTY